MGLVATVTILMLIGNLAAVVVAVARRRPSGTWILLILLSGTTGAGLIAVSLLLLPQVADRAIDTAWVFAALAAVSAATLYAVHQRQHHASPQGATPETGEDLPT